MMVLKSLATVHEINVTVVLLMLVATTDCIQRCHIYGFDFDSYLEESSRRISLLIIRDSSSPVTQIPQ